MRLIQALKGLSGIRMDGEIVAQLLGDASVVLVLVWRLMRCDDLIDRYISPSDKETDQDE